MNRERRDGTGERNSGRDEMMIKAELIRTQLKKVMRKNITNDHILNPCLLSALQELDIGLTCSVRFFSRVA
jgi:hypothetical protein